MSGVVRVTPEAPLGEDAERVAEAICDQLIQRGIDLATVRITGLRSEYSGDPLCRPVELEVRFVPRRPAPTITQQLTIEEDA